ncbi:unnamed protein product [Sphagnum tenellum]
MTTITLQTNGTWYPPTDCPAGTIIDLVVIGGGGAGFANQGGQGGWRNNATYTITASDVMNGVSFVVGNGGISGVNSNAGSGAGFFGSGGTVQAYGGGNSGPAPQIAGYAPIGLNGGAPNGFNGVGGGSSGGVGQGGGVPGGGGGGGATSQGNGGSGEIFITYTPQTGLATSKDQNQYLYTLSGVGGQVQFGKAGGQILSNAGVFSALTANGSNLARFQVGDPVGLHDSVSLEYLTNVANGIISNIATLTSEISGVNANLVSNISTLTTFVNSVTANLVSNVSTLTSEINSVGANLASNVSVLTTDINLVNANLVSNVTTLLADINSVNTNAVSNIAILTTDINLINANLVSNVATLLADINALSSNTINSLATHGFDITNINANSVSNISTLSNTINLVNSNLVSNFSTLTTEINLVNSNLVSNFSTFTTAINMLASNASANLVILLSDIATLNSNINAARSQEATDIISTNANVAGNFSLLTQEIDLVDSNLTTQMAALSANVALSATTILTGDVTGNGVGTVPTILATTGVTAGTYGSSSAIPVIRVDAKGRVLTVNTVAFSATPNAAQIASGLGYTPVNKAGDSMTGTLTVPGLVATAGFVETYQALGSGTSINVSQASYFSKTITAATTLTVTGVPASGLVGSFVLELVNGGAYTITWPSGTTWAAATAPTLSTSGTDLLAFLTYNGGTTWRGLLLAKGMG